MRVPPPLSRFSGAADRVRRVPRATWRSGDASDCKSAYPGSIPGVASIKMRLLRSRFAHRFPALVTPGPIWHATGIRIRSMPVTLDKLIV